MMAPPQLSRTEAHYRQFISGRWTRVWRLTLLFSAIPVLLSGAQWSTPQSWGSLMWSLSCVTIGGLVIFALCAWPLHVLRKIQLSPHHTSSNTPQFTTLPATTFGAFLLNIISQSRTWRVVGWYLWTSWVVTIVTSMVMGASSEVDVKLGVFNATRLYPYHLNERLVFLLVSTSWTSILHSLYSILTSSSPSTITYKSLSWPSITPLTPISRKTRLWAEARARVGVLIAGALVCGWAEWLGYGLVRKLVWGSVVRTLGWPAKQFLIRFALSRTNPLTLELLGRLILIQLSIALVIEVPAAMFTVFTTQPLDFSPLVAKSGAGADRYLADALQSKDLFLMNFTMAELNDVSYEPSRRKAILGDLSTKPTLWTTLWRGIMIQLGTSRHNINTQGGRLIPVTESATPTSSPAFATERDVLPLRTVKPENVFRIAPTAAIANSWVDKAIDQTAIKEQSLVATGTKVQANVGSGAQGLIKWTTTALSLAEKAIEFAYAQIAGKEKPLALGDKAKETVERVKSSAEKVQGTALATIQQKSQDVLAQGQHLLDSELVKPKVDTVAAQIAMIKPAVGYTKGFANWVVKVYERTLARRWVIDEFNLVVPRRRMDEKAIRALTAFIVNSYGEDQYGQVQQNVTSTLEAFVKLHSELTAYKAEVIGKAQGKRRAGIWVAVAEKAWIIEVQPVLTNLEVCIRAIRLAFGADMQAFKFPPDIAKLLEKAANAGIAMS